MIKAKEKLFLGAGSPTTSIADMAENLTISRSLTMLFGFPILCKRDNLGM